LFAVCWPNLRHTCNTKGRWRMDSSDFRNSAKIPPASPVMGSEGSLEIRAADARIHFLRGNRAFCVASNC
jgi:hypothetical protein